MIPEKNGCKLLFDDERICKKKIKCHFKKCDVFEDKTGYILDYKKKENRSTLSIRWKKKSRL